MMKLILLVKRKAGLTHEEFKTYYQTTHAVLAASVMAKCVKYVRNFVTEEIAGAIDFDVVTEFWFDVEGPWVEARKHLTDFETQQRLAADEERFMDRASMRFFLVDEHVSDPALLLGNGRCGGVAHG